MSTPISPMMASASPPVDPRGAGQTVPVLSERGDHPVDLDRQPPDRTRRDSPTATGSRRPARRGWGPKRPSQGGLELREFAAQLAPGQLGEDLRVAAAGHQGVEHVPTRSAQHIRRHLDNFTPASWRILSRRCASRVRSSISGLAEPGKSRSSRIGGGGTKLARTSPCSISLQIHSASAMSVLRPGTLRMWRALSNQHSNASSSRRRPGFQYDPGRLPSHPGHSRGRPASPARPGDPR